jgi:poly(3-hydroxybutyrate) depolymerase
LTLFLIFTGACVFIFFRSSGCGPDKGFSTGNRTITSDETEREYYLKLPENYDPDNSYPLIFAYHGFTSDHTVFSEGEYDLQEAVGDDAILVYPNALEINGETQWDYEADLDFFDDLYAELEANLCFDKRKVFATGHSDGAGFTHTLGCKRGNVLRAIAPVSGTFLDYEGCTGQVAVMMIHGDNDTIMTVGAAMPSLDYWKNVNRCSSEADNASQGFDADCEAYEGCNLKYPVSYCEFGGGHVWPDSGGAAIWDFFEDLPLAIPTSATGKGDKPPLFGGTVSFKVLFPADFAGMPDKLSLSLYPAGSTLPLSVGPDYILKMDVPLGDYTFGSVSEYNDVGISLLGVEFGDYAFGVTIYVEGGSFPIPTSGKDYMALQDITIDNSTINIETPFELELMIY